MSKISCIIKSKDKKEQVESILSYVSAISSPECACAGYRTLLSRLRCPRLYCSYRVSCILFSDTTLFISCVISEYLKLQILLYMILGFWLILISGHLHCLVLLVTFLDIKSLYSVFNVVNFRLGAARSRIYLNPALLQLTSSINYIIVCRIPFITDQSSYLSTKYSISLDIDKKKEEFQILFDKFIRINSCHWKLSVLSVTHLFKILKTTDFRCQ